MTVLATRRENELDTMTYFYSTGMHDIKKTIGRINARHDLAAVITNER